MTNRRTLWSALVLLLLTAAGCRESSPTTTVVLVPAIRASPSEAPSDEAVAITLAGLAPGQRVTVTATLRDDEDGEWAAWAAFHAGGDGGVNLTTHSPLTGTYTTADPMGLFWSMRPRDPDDSLSLFANFATRPIPVTLTLSGADGELASTILLRRRLPLNVTAVDVDEDGLVGRFYQPSGPGPHAALLVLGGSGGGLRTNKAIALANHGYATLALAYFGIDPLPESLTEIPLEYFGAALTWLQAQPTVDGSGLGVVGTSRGGELALLLGATYPELTAVAGYVPSGVVWGNTSATSLSTRSAWTYQGEPVHYATSMGPWSLAAAEIPVERINGPVLLISGGQDAIWPSTRLSDIAYERLVAHDHPFPFEHLAYPDAGHLLPLPYWPATITEAVHPVTGQLLPFGGSPAANAAAGADAWRHLLTFLDIHFKAAGPP